MNKRDVKIEVFAYSSFANGLTIPEFSSIYCDGKECPRQFISGYGIIADSGDSVHLSKNSYVAFCGFSENHIQKYVITNINNVASVDNLASNHFASVGYCTYIINAIKAINISIGDKVLVDVNETLRPIVTSLIEFFGAKPVAITDANHCIDKVLCDTINIQTLDKVGDYSHVVHLGNLTSIPTIKHQQIISITSLGELDNESDYAVDGRSFPKHYVLNSFSKNIETAVWAISKIHKQVPNAFEIFDIKELKCATTNIPNIEFNHNGEFSPNIHYLRSLFNERIDSGLINIVVMSSDINKSWSETQILTKYITNNSQLQFSTTGTDSYLLAVAKLAQGTVIHCTISKSSRQKMIIEMHYDGQSVVMDTNSCTLYQQSKIVNI